MASLLRHRDFRLVWASDTVSQFGAFIGTTMLPLLVISVLAATPFEVGVVTAASSAAFLLIGLPAGAWVDRMRKRPLMIAADVTRAIALLTIPVAAWMGVLTLAQVVVVALGVGVATVFYDIAAQSYLPNLVGREVMGDAVSKLQVSASVAEMGGPPLAGWIAQALGAANGMLLIGFSYLWSALFVTRVRAEEKPPQRPEHHNLLREITSGLKFVFSNAVLRAIALSSTSINFFHSIIGAVSVLFLVRTLGFSPGVVGLILAAAGVGALLGAVTAPMWHRWFGQARVIWAAPLLIHPIGLLIPLGGRGWAVAFVVVGQAALAYAAVVYDSSQASLRQIITPDHFLGRMNASIRFVVWGSMPIGGLVGGALAEWVGIRPVLWVGTVGLLISAVWPLLSPLRYVRDHQELISAQV